MNSEAQSSMPSKEPKTLTNRIAAATAVVIGLTALLNAVDVFANQAQAFSCKILPWLPWCNALQSTAIEHNAIDDIVEKLKEKK
jgi:hypothetical protein